MSINFCFEAFLVCVESERLKGAMSCYFRIFSLYSYRGLRISFESVEVQK